ncbi:MAG TPA: prolyl oligopeptidase family serine peptidase [Flavitalea sp.]|nr:prolyl oligopeptidase family serine peptidase [Flavitalea sp.]
MTVGRVPEVSNRYTKGTKISFLLITGLLFSSGVAFFTNLVYSSYDKPLYDDAFIEYVENIAAPFTPFTFVNNRGDTSRYRLLTPINYNSTIKYPLLVCLHHAGSGTDNVMQVQAAEIAPMFVDSAIRNKYPCFVLVPQCSPGATWGGLPNSRSDEQLAFSAIERVRQDYSIDSGRVYVTGASMGGYGTWNFISRRPNLFAAAIPICSGADPVIAKRIASIPVWVFHGENDPNVPVRYSRDMIKALRDHGGNPRYTEVAEGTHNISSLVEQTPGLLDWLFAQKK